MMEISKLLLITGMVKVQEAPVACEICPPLAGVPHSFKVEKEILASRNSSEGEGGLTPPPAKRPRVVPGGSVELEQSTSSSGTSSENPNREGGVLEVAGVGEHSGGRVEGGPHSFAMQSNGVIHENGRRTTSDFAVNGLASALKSNGHEQGSESEEVSGRGSANGHSVLVRKRKQRQLSDKDSDIVRLIGQHLREMGFNDTLASLVEETGCPLEHPVAATFRTHVIAGNWDEASKSLSSLVPLLEDGSSIEKMRLLLLQEKYLELLENGCEIEALHCLRHELAPIPLHHSDKQLQLFTSYMMYSDKELLRKAANWPGLRGGAREQLMDKLQGFLSSSVMLPPKRLQQLLTQAVQLQVDKCPFHYMEQDTSDYSFLTDHICTRAHFPSESVHVLTDHAEEVWFVKFSHDGTRLASASKDGQAIIWDVTGPRPSKKHTLKAQGEGISVLDWSPDDSHLLCCGRDDNPEAIVFSTQNGEIKCRVAHSSDDSLTCCAWHNSGTKFYVGGTKGQFLECAMDGSVVASWEGIRVQAIATHPTSDNVYAADTHNRIRQYNFRDKSSSTLVIETHSIMSFTLSKNGRHAILNLATQGVHLWDLQDRCLIRHYQGISQSLYVIYACFGGVGESFLASGSEDHHVYVWHHSRETPVVILKGHSRPVSCVHWNTVHPTMLATASDDGTVRIWGTEEQMKAESKYRKEREHLQEQLQQEGNPLLGSLAHHSQSCDPEGPIPSEGEMDVQPLDTSHSSDPDSNPSDLERIESSASSLSLANLRPVILEGMEPRQDSSGSASSWSLSAIDEAVSRVRLSLEEATGRVHLSSLDFGTSPRVVSRASIASAGASADSGDGGGGGGGGGRIRLQVSLTHDSSIDQESSQLSQDSSSNGSISQAEEMNEEETLSDSRLRYRTELDSPSLFDSSSASRVTSSSSGSAVSGRAPGTSVIVGGGRTEASGVVGGGGGGHSPNGGATGETTAQLQGDLNM